MSALTLLVDGVAHIFLTLLPMAACALIARRYGVTNWILQLMAAVSGSGLLGFAAFWVYLANPHLGRAFAIIVNVLCAVVLVDASRARFSRWREFAVFAPVTALFGSAALFNLSLGYLYGNVNAGTEIAENRYLAGLPGDNAIPTLFTQQLQSTTRPLPNYIIAFYQSSDRPPLQTGYYLMQEAVLGHAHSLDYQVMGTVLQSTWVFGLWAYLYAAHKPGWAMALCHGAVLFSGFAIVNSFFTWPKLLAATGVLLVAATLLTRELRQARGSKVTGAFTGVTLGCSMLGHPGSAFVVLAILLTLLVLWRIPSWQFLASVAIGTVVAYLPWMLYQKYYQPPGNALNELQLAGQPQPVPNQSLSHVIVDAYRQAGLHRTVENKKSNFQTPTLHTYEFVRGAASLAWHLIVGPRSTVTSLANQEVVWQFYYLGPALGLVGWGMVILVGRGLRNLYLVLRAHNRDATPEGDRVTVDLVGLLALAFTIIVWCLTLFGPAATVVHQGSYYVEVIGLALGVLGWWTFSRWVATAVVVGQSAFCLVLYTWFTPFAKGVGTPFTRAASHSMSLLLVLAIMACVASLCWIGRYANTSAVITDQERSSTKGRHSSTLVPTSSLR